MYSFTDEQLESLIRKHREFEELLSHYIRMQAAAAHSTNWNSRNTQRKADTPKDANDVKDAPRRGRGKHE